MFYSGADRNSGSLNIASIRIIEHRVNLEGIIGALTALDNILSNNVSRDYSVAATSKIGGVLRRLFEAKLFGAKLTCNPYVAETFKCFVHHKTKIQIETHQIYEHVEDQEILNGLFYDICGMDHTNEVSVSDLNIYKDRNLPKRILFDIFHNVQVLEIVITNTDFWTKAEKIYPISWFTLLNLIKDTLLNEVNIFVEKNPKVDLKKYTPGPYG